MVETTLKTATRKDAKEHVKHGGGAFYIQDPKAGDLKYIWDPNNELERREAKNLFDRMMGLEEEDGKKYVAFYVKDGEPAEKMETFDGRAGAVHITKMATAG